MNTKLTRYGAFELPVSSHYSHTCFWYIELVLCLTGCSHSMIFGCKGLMQSHERSPTLHLVAQRAQMLMIHHYCQAEGEARTNLDRLRLPSSRASIIFSGAVAVGHSAPSYPGDERAVEYEKPTRSDRGRLDAFHGMSMSLSLAACHGHQRRGIEIKKKRLSPQRRLHDVRKGILNSCR